MPEPELSGYRQLSEQEKEMINKIREVANEIAMLVDKVHDFRDSDHRWTSIARTDLQKGFMGLVRAVARPRGF